MTETLVGYAGKSTIVRTRRDKPIPRAIGALCRAAPQVAAAFAEWAFLRPGRSAAADWETALLPAGTETMIDSDGRRLPVWQWGHDEDPAVLLVHGWAGRGSQLAPLAAPLLTQGYRVLTFDAPAHGGASGRRTTLPAMARAIHDVVAWAEVKGGLAALVAHSFGAAAATVALGDGLAARKVVYVAPAADLIGLSAHWMGHAGFTPDVVARMRSRIERRYGLDWDELNGPTIVQRLDQPALIVHDAHDRQVPIAHGVALAEAWPGASFLKTSGLGHQRILRAATLRRAVTSFLRPERPRRSVATPVAATVTEEADLRRAS